MNTAMTAAVAADRVTHFRTRWSHKWSHFRTRWSHKWRDFWTRRRSFWTTPEVRLIRAEITGSFSDLHALEKRNDTVARLVDPHLKAARASQNDRDFDAAWRHLLRAREEFIRDYDIPRLRLAAETLWVEISDDSKLTQWRRDAVKDRLVDTVARADEDALKEGIDSLIEAYKIRDVGVSNVYWRLAMSRHHHRILLTFGVPILAASVALLATSSSHMGERSWERGWVPCVLAVLLGVMGAITSAVQRSNNARPQRIPAQLGWASASISRVPIGAVAGLTVWLFSIASVDQAADINAVNLLLAAFGAGFAERLIVQGSNFSNDSPEPPTTTQGVGKVWHP